MEIRIEVYSLFPEKTMFLPTLVMNTYKEEDCNEMIITLCWLWLYIDVKLKVKDV